ncbi:MULTISPECIES: fumarylacetoacetate hydrolase family protein [unclassified Streptomyces]|uniref:fumarylacetoacetate hydrolase family protein n=1 Tax=unclassified Streptomyces TaxID=2593676 RepID=UPI0036E13664
MKFATHLTEAGPQGAVVVDGRLCPVADAAAEAGITLEDPSVRSLLATTTTAQRQAVAAAAAAVAARAHEQLPLLEHVSLLPPVPDPQKIICLALNSRDHCSEVGIDEPKAAWFFPKWQTSLVGHGATVHATTATRQLDWEGEVALVIGAPARNVPEDRALEYVAGIMPFNDLSARDLIHGLESIALTKSGDAQAPCGPVLVSLDEIGDLDDLRYRTRVNGEVKQDGSTSDQIFHAAAVIAALSRFTTLVPGDVIAMGTLPGVGVARTPQEFLQDGDVVEVEIDGVGVLTTTIGAACDEPVLGASAGSPTARAV